jgi:hypothetical protein
MALSRNLLTDLASLKRRGALDGFSEVVEIGAQQLAPNFLRDLPALDELYTLFGKACPELGQPGDAGRIDGIERLPDNAPSSRLFWQSLGFNYRSIEFDGHRDSIAIDLNRDAVPRQLRGKFHLVVNTGTTEHVANQDNAFRVMHDLATVGGIMIHALPAGGMMNHGLINYNTKFFFHLCRENGYEVLMLKTVATGINPVPQNILDSNRQFGDGVDAFHETGIVTEDASVTDFFVLAMLRKKNANPFVTPLDIPAELIRRPKTGVWHNLARRFGSKLLI